MEQKHETVQRLTSIPESIQRAAAMVDREEAWMRIGSFIDWLDSVVKKVIPEGEKNHHAITMDTVDDAMVITVPGLHGKTMYTVHAEPAFTNEQHVLYGFTLSCEHDDGEDVRNELFIMPDDVIEMLPHEPKGEDGRYPFSMDDFVHGLNERKTPKE